jgi:hypothetical protein
MSLRATEFEARVWRAARDRLAKRPKLATEFIRRSWGRWFERFVLLLVGFALPIPVFIVAAQLGRVGFFKGGIIPDGGALIAPALLLFCLLIGVVWYLSGRNDATWALAQTLPFSDNEIARQRMWKSLRITLIAIAPLSVYHAMVIGHQRQAWGEALSWGLILAVADLSALGGTTLVIAVALGHWFHRSLRVLFLFKAIVLLTLICILPIRLAQPGFGPPVLTFEGRRLLWWPTGWPLAVFESVLQGDTTRAIGFLIAIGVLTGLGVAAAVTLIRRCTIREFAQGFADPQLLPIYMQDSVWGPTVVAEPSASSALEAAISKTQDTAVVDFLKLEMLDHPLPAAEARQEVLRGDFLRPLADEELGWIERILRLSFFQREQKLTDWMLIDGRYWTHIVACWWAAAWFSGLWFGVGAAWGRRAGPGPPMLIMAPILLISVALVVVSIATTVSVLISGWPGLLWTNSASKGLPVFAHLPVSACELSAIRQRLMLLKILVVLVLSAPVLIGIAWMNNANVWPVLIFAWKLGFTLFAIQSWWFLGWQLSGSFFGTLRFYIESIALLIGFLILSAMFLFNDQQVEWTGPGMILCAQAMTWWLGRTLDRPVLELTGAQMPQLHRSFMLEGLKSSKPSEATWSTDTPATELKA